MAPRAQSHGTHHQACIPTKMKGGPPPASVIPGRFVRVPIRVQPEAKPLSRSCPSSKGPQSTGQVRFRSRRSGPRELQQRWIRQGTRNELTCPSRQTVCPDQTTQIGKRSCGVRRIRRWRKRTTSLTWSLAGTDGAANCFLALCSRSCFHGHTSWSAGQIGDHRRRSKLFQQFCERVRLLWCKLHHGDAIGHQGR